MQMKKSIGEKEVLEKDIGFKTIGISAIEDLYDVIEDIGFGTYGEVQKCRDKQTNEIVALKRIKKIEGEDGFPKMVIREVRLLQKLRHENVVKLKRVLHCNGTVFLVFEYCEFDLAALLYSGNNSPLSDNFLRSVMLQLMLCLQYLHSQRVIHRDLKPSNIFITRNNLLKLGDFGLAREMQNYARYSDKVITQWYRPPELLLGQTKYGTEVDIWSAGCILFEIVTKRPLFYPSKPTDSSQLSAIIKICGTPNDEDWPEWRSLPNSGIFNNQTPIRSNLKEYLKKHIPSTFQDLIPLLMNMVVMNPAKRVSAAKAIEFPFFSEFPELCDPRKLQPIKVEEIHQKNLSAKREEMKNKEKNKDQTDSKQEQKVEENGTVSKPEMAQPQP